VLSLSQAVLAKPALSVWFCSTGHGHKYGLKWKPQNKMEFAGQYNNVDFALPVAFLTGAAIQDFVTCLFKYCELRCFLL